MKRWLRERVGTSKTPSLKAYIEQLEAQLGQMYARHPESGGCYAALPKLRAKLAEREAELTQVQAELARWKAEAQWVASLALCGGPVTPKDAQRFQNILKGEL